MIRRILSPDEALRAYRRAELAETGELVLAWLLIAALIAVVVLAAGASA